MPWNRPPAGSRQPAAGSLFGSILAHLDRHGIAYRLLEHPPISTAEEASAVRGTPLEIAAKCIVFKLDGVFALFVMRASDAMRSRHLRRQLGVSRTRFASRDELLELTGCAPGAVPPFGRPVLDLDLYVDEALLQNDEVVFTPGRRDRSLVLAVEDWRRLVVPAMIFRFAT